MGISHKFAKRKKDVRMMRSWRSKALAITVMVAFVVVLMAGIQESMAAVGGNGPTVSKPTHTPASPRSVDSVTIRATIGTKGYPINYVKVYCDGSPSYMSLETVLDENMYIYKKTYSAGTFDYPDTVGYYVVARTTGGITTSRSNSFTMVPYVATATRSSLPTGTIGTGAGSGRPWITTSYLQVSTDPYRDRGFARFWVDDLDYIQSVKFRIQFDSLIFGYGSGSVSVALFTATDIGYSLDYGDWDNDVTYLGDRTFQYYEASSDPWWEVTVSSGDLLIDNGWTSFILTYENHQGEWLGASFYVSSPQLVITYWT
jgi:hypothetical protein